MKSQYEVVVDAIKSTHEAFLNDIDVKKSTVEVLENGKIVIFPVMKSNPPPKQALKQLARKLTKRKDIIVKVVD